MKASTWPLLPAIALMTALSGPLYAQTTGAPPPSPEQARMLEQEVRAWLTQMTGGAVKLPEGIVQFTPDATGYAISVPLGGLLEVEPKDAALTAHAHLLDDTRWAIDSERLPPSLKVTTRQRFPNDPDAPPVNPLDHRPQPGTHLETVTYEVKVGTQSVTGVFDPTYATASNTQGSIDSLDLVQTGGPAAVISHIGTTTTTSSSTPSGSGLTDVLIDSTMQNYETKTAITNGGPAITLTMKHVHLVSALTGFAHGKIAPLVAIAVATVNSVQAAQVAATEPPPVANKPTTRPNAVKPRPPRPGAKPGARPEATRRDDDAVQEPGKKPPTPAQLAAEAQVKTNLRAMLVAANGLLTGGKMDEVMDDLAFDVSGTNGTLSHAAFSFDGNAPQDALTASFALTLDGLTIPSLPPAFAGYIPSHFVIHPTVSNVSVGALTKLGMDATAPGSGNPPGADYAALFQHGGINFGFDQFGLDVADAKFTGTGAFNMPGPQTITGQAEISAQGLDALITRAQADPLLVQAVPVIIFLKGIAKTNAERSVWQVSLANGKVLVNGVDLSAIAGGMGH